MNKPSSNNISASPSPLAGKGVLLIVSGGIAAYKSLDFVRQCRRLGAEIIPVMTQGAGHFITPLALASLAGAPVRETLFDSAEEAQFGHIDLARRADLILTAPASASRIAAYAAGLASDLAGAIMLAREAPAMLAPAMNQAMWRNPATQRALAQLEKDGVHIIPPESGELACGETGPGRMAEVAVMIAVLERFFAAQEEKSTKKLLTGLRAIITSGPTREAIDPVRYLSNHSSGRQGRAIASALAEAGAETILITGPDGKGAETGMVCHQVESARDMLAATKAALPADIAVCAAAVGDWHIVKPYKQKWKKCAGEEVAELQLCANPDILADISRKGNKRPRLVIGFAAETENLLTNAAEKMRRKGCDWIVANDVSPETGILGGEENEIHLLRGAEQEHWPRMSKRALAQKLVLRIAENLGRA